MKKSKTNIVQPEDVTPDQRYFINTGLMPPAPHIQTSGRVLRPKAEGPRAYRARIGEDQWEENGT